MIIGGWHPGWRIVDAHPGHARHLRGWVQSAIARHHCAVDEADAALAISELYANAVIHGPVGGRVLVGYCLWPAWARIIVGDGSGPATPRVGQGTGLAQGGRGLQLIDSIAIRWGTFRLPGVQTVWCDLGQPTPVSAEDTWVWLGCILSDHSLSPPAPPDSRAHTEPAGRQPARSGTR